MFRSGREESICRAIVEEIPHSNVGSSTLIQTQPTIDSVHAVYIARRRVYTYLFILLDCIVL